MHCGLLRDCAGARKAKESLLWYEKKNLDYEERKKEEEWSTVLLSQMAWESCVKAFSHLCSLRSGRKTGKLYIDIHVFIYIYIGICVYMYIRILQCSDDLQVSLHFTDCFAFHQESRDIWKSSTLPDCLIFFHAKRHSSVTIPDWYRFFPRSF